MQLRNLRRVVLASLLLVGCRTAAEERDRREVLATFQGFFDWIETGEPARADATVLPEAAFANVRQTDGKAEVRHFTMAGSLAKRPTDTRALRESIVGEPTVLIGTDIATVWCNYEFHVDGKLSHTGIDSFSLFRTPAGWRVAGGAYSILEARP